MHESTDGVLGRGLTGVEHSLADANSGVKRVVIIGAGGHGREVAEVLRHQMEAKGGPEPIGFVDDNTNLHGKEFDKLPVLGDFSWFTKNDSQTGVICAVGTPRICRGLVERAAGIGLVFVSAISPLAQVSPLAKVGRGVVVFPGVIANTGSRIGSHSILNIASTVSP